MMEAGVSRQVQKVTMLPTEDLLGSASGTLSMSQILLTNYPQDFVGWHFSNESSSLIRNWVKWLTFYLLQTPTDRTSSPKETISNFCFPQIAFVFCLSLVGAWSKRGTVECAKRQELCFKADIASNTLLQQ